MTVDREQIRRDAERYVADDLQAGKALGDFASDVLALLAELEQAERTRNSLAATLQMVDDRLAKVPALAEKAKRAKSQAAAPDYDEQAIRDALWDVVDSVLAAYQQAQS